MSVTSVLSVSSPHVSFYDFLFFFSSRRRHTRCSRDWSSDVCSSDLFALVVWSLARYYFPAVLSQSPLWEYWVLGVVAALLLFASVLVHELGHCLVALRYRIPIAQITLFIFGGMAQIRREAPTPKAEFLIAIAGPIVSVGVGLGFWLLAALPGAPLELTAVSEHLRNINLVLAIFNLVPGYPLDGGRVLRAALWAWSKNFHKATRQEIGRAHV